MIKSESHNDETHMYFLPMRRQEVVKTCGGRMHENALYKTE